MSGIRCAAVLWLAISLSACSAPHHHIALFTHPNPETPILAGKTVAVLPPIAVGSEQGTVIIAGAALDSIFESALAGIRFVPPREVVVRSQLSQAETAELSTRMGQHLPLFVAPKRRKTSIFSGARAGASLLPGRLEVSLQRDPYRKLPIAPDRIPPRLLRDLRADYALITVAFSTYQRVHVWGGAIPITTSLEVRADRPRCLFALYDTSTGERIWDVIVGVAGSTASDQGISYAEEFIDPRMLPVLGVAYLLTGEFEKPLERALRPRSLD